MTATATVYRDVDYQGPFARMLPGFYSGQDLQGFYHQSAYGSGEDLDNAISSIRVGFNTIVALYGGQSPSASAGARVLVGPLDVPDLSALGMNDKVSAVQVVSYKKYDSGVPRTGGVVLYGDYAGQGKSSTLEQGDYSAARLASEEIKFPANSLRSMRVSANVLVILYSGPDFDASADAVMVVGPAMVDDLDRIGFLDRTTSIRVVYADPRDYVYTRTNGPATGAYMRPHAGMLSYTAPPVTDPRAHTRALARPNMHTLALTRPSALARECANCSSASRGADARGTALPVSGPRVYTAARLAPADPKARTARIVIVLFLVLVLVLGAYLAASLRVPGSARAAGGGPATALDLNRPSLSPRTTASIY